MKILKKLIGVILIILGIILGLAIIVFSIYAVTHPWEVNKWITEKFLSGFGIHDGTVIIVITIILIIIGIGIKFLY